jgi:hypothetical protein
MACSSFSATIVQGHEPDAGADAGDDNNPTDAAPVPGNPGQLSASNVTWKQLTLNWAAATDDHTPTAQLVYTLYESLTDNLSSVAAATTNGTLVTTVVGQLTAAANLVAGKNNYLTVVVTDGSGNSAVYQR